MRILLSHPTYWPEVRRGSERVVHDLATGLARRGHEVTILTSHRAAPCASLEDEVRVVRAWRPPGLAPLRHYEDFIHNTPNVVARLLSRRDRFDVVHTLFPSDGWAAAKARRLGGPPLVFTLHGAPTRRYLVSRRYRLEMIQAAIAAAAEVTVLSEHVAELLRRYLQVDPRILPAGVELDRFPPGEPRANHPTLLCAADLSDPRKRGPLLLEAFARVREERPDARLVIAVGGGVQQEQPTGPGVEMVRCEDTTSLARAYASAWATVLPSVEEAFGLVIVESLAAGTPVVAACSGASPGILTDERIGVLFDGDHPAAIAAAIDRAFDLTHRHETVAACRGRASDFSWARVLDAYEDTYAAAMSGSSPRMITTNGRPETS